MIPVRGEVFAMCKVLAAVLALLGFLSVRAVFLMNRSVYTAAMSALAVSAWECRPVSVVAISISNLMREHSRAKGGEQFALRPA